MRDVPLQKKVNFYFFLTLISTCVGRRPAVPQPVHLWKMKSLTRKTSPTNCLSNLVFSWFHTRDQFKNLHWTNVIWKKIRSLHPYCSFAFKRHSVTTIGSQRTNPLFTCAGYCRFDDCCVQVNLKIENESSHKAVDHSQGGNVWHSRQQLRRRPIRGEERLLIVDLKTPKRCLFAEFE